MDINKNDIVQMDILQFPVDADNISSNPGLGRMTSQMYGTGSEFGLRDR